MKSVDYKLGKLMVHSIVSLLGFIRKHSDDTTKLKIDNMISNQINKLIK